MLTPAEEAHESSIRATHTMDTNTLEAMVDRLGMHIVLDYLSDIAVLKASHVEEAWQDKGLAKAWMKVANHCHVAGNRVLREAIP